MRNKMLQRISQGAVNFRSNKSPRNVFSEKKNVSGDGL
jgi:hypothetical protein